MARAYSDDLRRKILQAYERSRVSYQKLADRFGVSRSYVHRIQQQKVRTGKMERIPQSRNGRPSRLTEEIRKTMKGWIAVRPDLTLAELQQQLKEKFDLSVSLGQIWLVLKAMGLRLKKSHSTPRSRTRRRDSRGGKAGRRRSAR
jgi:transposase